MQKQLTYQILGHIRPFVWYNYHYFNRSLTQPIQGFFQYFEFIYLFEKCLPTCLFQIHWLRGAREYSRCRGTIVHCKQEDLKLAQTTLGQGQCIELQGDAKNIIGPYPLRCTECTFFSPPSINMTLNWTKIFSEKATKIWIYLTLSFDITQ